LTQAFKPAYNSVNPQHIVVVFLGNMMPTYTFFATYTTQTEADIFCRGCYRGICRKAGPGQYQIWLLDI
jgi:hypothetical protein